jgi:hypothetical protein
MRRSAWKADSIRQLGYRRLRNVQKVVIKQYVDGTAHIVPQGRTLPDRRKIEAKSIDRPSRNVRPFIWPSGLGCSDYHVVIAQKSHFALNGALEMQRDGAMKTMSAREKTAGVQFHEFRN